MPHIGHVNPFRYRGYYYDKATGLYFLESRFYDPETGRFINADTVEHLDPKAINDLNLYAYCGNNPVMNVDPSGHESIAAVLICICVFAFVCGMIGFGLTMHADYQDDQDVFNGSISAETYVANTLVAAAFGALLGALFAWIGPSSFTFALPLLKVSAGSVAVAGTATVTVTGAEILAGVAGLGLIAFAKGFGPRMGHNQHEKQMWNKAMRDLGISDKDLIQRLHREKNKYPYQDTLKGLEEILQKILSKWGK